MSTELVQSTLEITALVLLASLVIGLVRIWRGPGHADRMLAAPLFGTTRVALLLILAHLQAMPALRDVAAGIGVVSLCRPFLV